MGEGTTTNSLINVGELSKPANTLIEKVFEALGGACRPGQIKRVARAEAEAELIRAEAKIKITEIQERGLARLVHEEGERQENIENITLKALPHLSENSKPENIEKDWMTNFFGQCRSISDDEMQTLWAAVLAGEANRPGTYSKRTINFLASIDKRDAELFSKLCSFCWWIGGATVIIFDTKDKIYEDAGIAFNDLHHLSSIGLISFEPAGIGSYQKLSLPRNINCYYYDKCINIEFATDENNKINTGKVLLTPLGKELVNICDGNVSEEYFLHVLSKWYAKGYVMSTPLEES